MPRVILHACCGPCATHPVEVLRDLGYQVTLFFSNANIWPPEEHAKRLANVLRLVEQLDLPLIEDTATHEAWRRHISGLEGECEGGMRCRHCFQFNLARTQAKAQELGFDRFTTSLTVSPHKCARTIFAVGRQLDDVRFLAIDFKKDNGLQRSIELSRNFGLYRQNYCGCEFSGGG